MNYWNKICGVGGFLFFISQPIAAQVKSLSDVKSSTFLKVDVLKDRAIIKSTFHKTSFTTLLPANFYTQNFGFFCKKELAVEKYLKMPLKVRLGSVQQCDYLEGKQMAVKPYHN